jgi:hypothetical protein
VREEADRARNSHISSSRVSTTATPTESCTGT